MAKIFLGSIIGCIILILGAGFVYSEEYKVDIGDILLITVYEQSDLTTKTRVNSKGEITFPLIGLIYVKGSSEDEIAEEITVLLEKDFLVNPQVNVFREKNADKFP